MSSLIELRPLSFENTSAAEQVNVAQRVQKLLWEDFVRLEGVNPDELRTAVDPDSDVMVAAQVQKIRVAGQNNTVYTGVYRTDADKTEAMQGITKIGDWRRGDQKPFGHSAISALWHAMDPLASPQRGLHAFAMSDDSRHLTLEALTALLNDPTDIILNRYSQLRVAVDEQDTLLSESLQSHGAKVMRRRRGSIALARYERPYQLHIVDPRKH